MSHGPNKYLSIATARLLKEYPLAVELPICQRSKLDHEGNPQIILYYRNIIRGRLNECNMQCNEEKQKNM